MKTMTQEEYNKQPAEYRGIVDGKPYLLQLDEKTQGTVYGPVRIAPIVSLTCCCCGAECHGRQWYNRDTGYGLCPKCAKWISSDKRETPESMRENYGDPGVHYFTA
jgi:hypothetical protein